MKNSQQVRDGNTHGKARSAPHCQLRFQRPLTEALIYRLTVTRAKLSAATA